MTDNLVSTDEKARLDVLRRDEISDALPEPTFDDITFLAAQICQTPVASVTLLDVNRQRGQSRFGWTGAEASHAHSFGSHALLQPCQLLIVHDALEDERFAANPFVTSGPKIRFYAGSPLVTHTGDALGVLCVMDTVPRALTATQLDSLRALSRQVLTQLELRRNLAEADSALTRLQLTEASHRGSENKYRALIEQAADGIHTYDADGNFMEVNPRLCEMLGYTREELLRLNVKDLLPAADRAKFPIRFAELRAGQSLLTERRLLRKDGSLLPVEISGRMVEEGVFQAVIRDVTERKKAERALRRAKESLADRVRNRTKELIETNEELRRENAERRRVEQALRESEQRCTKLTMVSPVGIFQADAQGACLYVNERWCEIAGLTPHEARGEGWMRAVHPADREIILTGWRQATTNDSLFHLEYRFKRPDGSVTWVLGQAVAEKDGDGAVTGFVGTITDITERKRAEAALKESEERYRSLVALSPDAIIVHCEGKFIYVNPAGVALVGAGCAEELLGRNVIDFVHPDYQEIVRGHIQQTIVEKTPTPLTDIKIVKLNGHVFDAEVRGTVLTHGGQPAVQSVIRDISVRKRAEEQLFHEAYHDALTGLPNRALFKNHLTLAIERAKRHADYQFAVLFMDIDRFKYINDSLGHHVGDQLLLLIADRIEKCLRPGDTVARQGGDEFAVLLDGIADSGDVIRVADRVQHALRQPLNLEGHEMCTSASIGIALSATGYDQPEDVLRDADTAMYRAKMLGKARYVIFDKSMHERAIEVLRVEANLRRAIERRELCLKYQPIISLRNNQISGFEALVHWRHPERGIVPPLDFIPVAEETGLIVPIGIWVLREACRQARLWQAHSAARLTLSVNLSGKQFMQPDLVEQIKAVLHETGFDPRSLQLEITESVVMDNAEATVEMLMQLKALDVQLAIDDFGTGYSSLSYLHRFPIDVLKIDRSFVSRMNGDGENSEIVRTILTLANNLGMTVVAEGVETPEQLARLQEMNCAFGQGFFFSQSVYSEAAEELMCHPVHAG